MAETKPSLSAMISVNWIHGKISWSVLLFPLYQEQFLQLLLFLHVYPTHCLVWPQGLICVDLLSLVTHFLSFKQHLTLSTYGLSHLLVFSGEFYYLSYHFNYLDLRWTVAVGTVVSPSGNSFQVHTDLASIQTGRLADFTDMRNETCPQKKGL